jgi:DNA-binding MarR family transcriptional regulator
MTATGKGSSTRKTREPLAPDPALGEGADGEGHFNPHLPDVDYGVLDTLTGYANRRAQIRIYEDFVRSLAAWQITPPRFSALQIIARNPGVRLTDLARILGIARSGAVMLFDALEAMQLVAREPSPTDRRAYALALTATGRQTLAAVTEAVCDHDARIGAQLSEAERQTLLRLLDKLAPGEP